MDETKSKNKQDAVKILMAEKYREVIALQEKDPKSKIRYPIIVLHDEQMEYDRNRFYNDNISHTPYMDEYNGKQVTRVREYEPYMPYNLNYRLEIVCRQRVHLDSVLVWLVRNVPDRGSISVPYEDDAGNKLIYDSLIKRGPIINADEGTSSVLYRRTCELQMTSLIEGKFSATYTRVKNYERSDIDENVQGEEH